VAPAFDSGAFTHNAIEALDSAQSESTTAALALRARLDDKLPQPYVDNVVTDSEQAIGPIQDSFGSVDPPIRADNQLRDAVSRLLGDTADALAAARIAVRQHDESGMRQSATDLEKLAQQLEQKSQALS
jgi:rRNA processing protein Gar1